MFISPPFICSSLVRSALCFLFQYLSAFYLILFSMFLDLFLMFLLFLLSFSVLHVPWLVPHVPTISVLLFCSPCFEFVLFSMFQIFCVLHVPDMFCSLCSKLVLFSIFQTCMWWDIIFLISISCFQDIWLLNSIVPRCGGIVN